ncbi:hypothetical protein [Paraburkholderia mimosarum]|uniref:hypothetical protein n=1 Tax=Paraburkholderia mimosarum TaxID=312026 RepID=UPI0003FA9226|nr:hypothetical protein [Paraburkholderia mimosarum]
MAICRYRGTCANGFKQISAATIDRLLHDVREQAFSGQRRRAGGIGNAIRRAVPVRTFNDWNDPLPGYLEIVLVYACLASIVAIAVAQWFSMHQWLALCGYRRALRWHPDRRRLRTLPGNDE